MVSRRGFTRLGKTYLWLVIVAGFVAVGSSIHELYVTPLDRQWFILAALTLISGSATIRLPSSYASISTSETFVFTAVLLYGPAAGTVVVALDALVVSFWISKRQDEPHRAMFNLAAPALSVWVASHLFFFVAGISPLIKEASPTNAILPALLLFALTYFTLNSWLITFVIALERKLSPIVVWKRSFVWLSLNHLGSASVAFLLVGYNRKIDLGYVGVIIPLLLVLYFTFKTAMARVEDADKHLAQVNRLYLSTIETLAMAIDAKDQVTHGHIRRVQAHTIALARAVGVTDESLLKAIEAAALLHDMGKLAVPEYILNKPGKLTEAEFEKMKLHASVGADILSAIDFPYPVVPIVRHHHENWDGTGYPAGIRGTDIPIGARILSVVDCFDALTSDRPYRPRLTDSAALAILRERRGTMYDPMVVDTFFQVHSATDHDATTGREQPNELLNTIARSRNRASPNDRTATPDQVSSSAVELLTMHELARALAGQVSLSDAGDVIAKHLRNLIPWTLGVFYLYDRAADELEARHVIGEHGAAICGMRVALGQRLSGWVAANRQTIANSDPSLDLSDVPGIRSLGLRSCLSTALVFNEQLVGVVSLYSGEINGFNADHRRIIEAVARQIAHTLKSAAEFDGVPRRDALTGLPNRQQLEQLVNSSDGSNLILKDEFTLLFIVTEFRGINTVHGADAGNEALRHVVRQSTACLRVADILFRYDSSEFVALLNDADSEAANLIASEIRDSVTRVPLLAAGSGSLSISVGVTAVSYPSDGDSLQELVSTARARAARALVS
jgi:diguanylate cyclase (GGDEF)-like protein/putative nucleotidyltransferase with HDIG domain